MEEYIHAVLMLHAIGKEINDENLRFLLSSAGVTVDDDRLRILLESLEGKDIEAIISKVEKPRPVIEFKLAAEYFEDEEEEEEEEEEKADLTGLERLFAF